MLIIMSMEKLNKVSIIIPVFNEVKTVEKILNKVKEVKIPVDREIIVCDDGSFDGTREILENLRSDNSIKIHISEINEGKGSAIRNGLNYVTGDIIIIQDADLEYDPNDYSVLLKPILNNEAKVVYGSRFIKQNKWGSSLRKSANVVLSLLTSILYGQKITDMETCYKAIKSDLLKNIDLRSNGFEIEPEITAKILKAGIKIIEVPISYNSRGVKQGKKIRYRDGIKAVIKLISCKFN